MGNHCLAKRQDKKKPTETGILSVVLLPLYVAAALPGVLPCQGSTNWRLDHFFTSRYHVARLQRMASLTTYGISARCVQRFAFYRYAKFAGSFAAKDAESLVANVCHAIVVSNNAHIDSCSINGAADRNSYRIGMQDDMMPIV